MFGMDSADINATCDPADALARPTPRRRLLPFTLPDWWLETPDSAVGPASPRSTMVRQPRPVVDPALLATRRASPPDPPATTPKRDKGTELILKADNQSKVSPSFYNPWALPGRGGATTTAKQIENCNSTIVAIGHPMDAEPGNMVGPTRAGHEELVAKDPGRPLGRRLRLRQTAAAFGTSPRVASIPVYDPVFYEKGKQNGRNAAFKIANFIGFFIDGMQGNEVIGRITPIGGVFRRRRSRADRRLSNSHSTGRVGSDMAQLVGLIVSDGRRLQEADRTAAALRRGARSASSTIASPRRRARPT